MAKSKQKQKQSLTPSKTSLAKQKEIEKLIIQSKAEQKPRMYSNSVYRPQPGWPRQEPRAPVQQHFPINSPTTATSSRPSVGSNPGHGLVHDTRRAGRPLVKDPTQSPASSSQNRLQAPNQIASLDAAAQHQALLNIDDGQSFNPKGHFPFLQLPGEIRNKIYDLCIPTRSFSITWLKRSKGQPPSLCYRQPNDSRRHGQAPKTKPDIFEWRNATRNPKRPNLDVRRRRLVMEVIYRQRSPIAMLWVCRAMYPEASSAFYGKCTFGFDQISSLKVFMENLTASNQRSITSLFIKYHAYGHPYLLENEKFKGRADDAFIALCFQVAKTCTSLAHLRLDLDYHRCPIRFGPLGAAIDGDFTLEWMASLWAFQDSALESLCLRVRSDITDGALLDVASHELRKELLKDNWDDKKQAGCDPFGYRLVKKGMVLNIVD